MKRPGIHLTELEYDAIISAVAMYEVDVLDRIDEDGETAKEARRERAALDRATRKIVRAQRGQG